MQLLREYDGLCMIATVILVSAGLKQQDIKTTNLTVVGTQIEARN